MVKALNVALIIAGWFLEIFWYYFRFIQDGTGPEIAIIEGLALTLFLSVVAYARTVNPGWYKTAMFLLLCAYSIFCTSGGQAYNLNVKLNESTTANIEQTQAQRKAQIRVESIDRQISGMETDLQSIRDQLQGIASIEDRGLWRTTVAAAEVQQTDILERMEALELEKMSLDYIEVATTRRDENIYSYYGKLFNWSADWLQIILQTTFSLFICLMAPFGITALTTGTTRAKPERQAVDHSDWEDEVEQFVHVSWMQIRSAKGDSIIPREVFLKHMESHGGFSTYKYREIKKAAIKANVVDKTRIIVYDESEAKRKIMEVLQWQSKEPRKHGSGSITKSVQQGFFNLISQVKQRR